MAVSALWKELDELVEGSSREAQIRIEFREQILELVMRLFDADFTFAVEKNAHVVLWNSQKLLFSRARAKSKAALAKSAAAQDEKTKKRHSRNALIAGVNSVNVLRTMYCEWTKLVALVNNEDFHILPTHSAVVLHERLESISEAEIGARKIFAKFVYLRLGDITRHMEQSTLSRMFYEKSMELHNVSPNDEKAPTSPSVKQARTQLDRLGKMVD